MPWDEALVVTYFRTSPIVRGLLVAASVVVIVAGMKAASPVLAPVLLALFLTVLLSPFLRSLERRGLPTWLAVVAVLAVVVVVGLALGLLLYVSLSGFLAKLPEYQAGLAARGSAPADWLASRGIDVSGRLTPDQTVWQAVFRAIGGAASQVRATLAQAFFVLVLVLTMGSEAPQVAARLPPGARAVKGAEERFSQSVQSQMRIQTVANVANAAIFALGLYVLGIDFVVLWAVLTFVMAYVPRIGVILSSVPPVILGLIEYGLTSALLIAAWAIVLNVAWDNVLAPRVMGRGLGLSPSALTIAFIFWTWVFGPIGALLTVPLTVILRLLFESAGETRWMAVVLSDRAGYDLQPIGAMPGEPGSSKPAAATSGRAATDEDREQAS
jgi:predicted PurR-regulated permease PerM